MDRAQKLDLGTFLVRVPSVEDLLIMKVVAHRPKDDLDVLTLLSHYPAADIGRVRYWVGAFAEILDQPELLEHLEQQVTRARPRS